jgi:hypothetical protein
MAQLRRHFGESPKFFFVFSKKISTKNKNSAFGIFLYPRAATAMMTQRSDEATIQSARERFRAETGGELKYDDALLQQWIDELRQEGRFYESYNSKNTIVLPSQLKSALGSALYERIIST